MLKRICDRCGAEALEHPTGFVPHSGQDTVADLCEKCEKELNKWMNNSKMKVVDPMEEDAIFASIPDLIVNDISKINNVSKITTESFLSEYLIVSREECEALLKNRQTVQKIMDIAYCDDIDNYDKMERILSIL